MSKKYLYGSLVMGLGLSGPLAAEPVPFSGVFLGGDLGFSNGNAEYAESISDSSRSFDTAKTKINVSGVSGAVALGVGQTFSNNLYLGGDIHGGLSGIKGDYKTVGAETQHKVNLKMTNFLGVQVHPGFVVGKEVPALFHAIVGLDTASWKVNTQSRIDNGTVIDEGKSLKKRLTGFTYGVGVMVMPRPSLAVGLKVTHTNYRKLPTIQHTKAVPDMLNYSLKPKTNTAMISVTKFFNF